MSVRCRVVGLASVLLLSVGAAQAGDGKLVQQVYAVSDLVLAASWDKQVEASPTSSAWAIQAAPAACEDRLIRMITDTILPRSWSRRGGPGTIEYYPQTMSLVVSQTLEVHEQITDLLAALRRLQDREVSVEIKFAEVADEMFQRLKRGGVFGDPSEETNPARNVVFLRDAEVFLLLEALQGDRRSSVMQAPRLTARSGQAAEINVTDPQTFVTGVEIAARGEDIEFRPKTEVIPLGVRISLRPAVSADRRFVKLQLDAKMNDLVSSEVPLFPITTPLPPKEGGPDAKPRTFTQYIQRPRVNRLSLKRTLVIPDGSTALLTGLKKKCEGRNEFGPPILRDLPVIGRLFVKVAHSCETRHVLVLVTPRIAIQSEKEERKAPEHGEQ